MVEFAFISANERGEMSILKRLGYHQIRQWPEIFILVSIVGISTVLAQSPLPRYAFGYFGGWYQPSLAKANAALEYSKQKFSGVGDDEFSGNFTVGFFFERRLAERWLIRSEVFYWQKEAYQTVSSSENSELQQEIAFGEGQAFIRLIPITINALYWPGNSKSLLEVYVGMGIGGAITQLQVRAQVHEIDTLTMSTQTHQLLSAEDKNWGILLQILGGVKCRVSPAISFVTEVRLISGQFYVEEPHYQVDEQVFLSGFKLALGMKYAWNR